MRNIIVQTLEESAFSVEELYNLRMAAYEQWREAGLSVSVIHAPFRLFSGYLTGKIVFVASDADTGELLAMHTFSKNRKRGSVSGSNLAVAPQAKHECIATRMLAAETERFKKAGYRYLLGSTAIPAVWSVRWHLKNGYYITGYKRSEKQNYASYTFCMPIALDIRHHPLDIVWTQPLAPLTGRISYMASYLITCLCKTRSGQLTALGRLAKKVRDSRLKA